MPVPNCPHLFSVGLDCILRALSQTAARLSLVICAGYGVLVYEHAVQSKGLSVGHLLGIPILLIMAVFYGLTLETVAMECRRNRSLQEDVQGLRQSEQALEQRRTQLETRVQG